MKAILTKKEIIKGAIFNYFYRKKIDKRYTVIRKFFSLGYTEKDLLKMVKTKEKRIEIRCKEREYNGNMPSV